MTAIEAVARVLDEAIFLTADDAQEFIDMLFELGFHIVDDPSLSDDTFMAGAVGVKALLVEGNGG